MFYNGNNSLCLPQQPSHPGKKVAESPPRKESAESDSTGSDGGDKKHTLTFHGGHHLLKTLMKFSVAERVKHDKKTKQFINDFNLAEKNAPYKEIRSAYGQRRDQTAK